MNIDPKLPSWAIILLIGALIFKSDTANTIMQYLLDHGAN